MLRIGPADLRQHLSGLLLEQRERARELLAQAKRNRGAQVSLEGKLHLSGEAAPGEQELATENILGGLAVATGRKQAHQQLAGIVRQTSVEQDHLLPPGMAELLQEQVQGMSVRKMACGKVL